MIIERRSIIMEKPIFPRPIVGERYVRRWFPFPVVAHFDLPYELHSLVPRGLASLPRVISPEFPRKSFLCGQNLSWVVVEQKEGIPPAKED